MQEGGKTNEEKTFSYWNDDDDDHNHPPFYSSTSSSILGFHLFQHRNHEQETTQPHQSLFCREMIQEANVCMCWR